MRPRLFEEPIEDIDYPSVLQTAIRTADIPDDNTGLIDAPGDDVIVSWIRFH